MSSSDTNDDDDNNKSNNNNALEEEILNTHMRNIQQHAEILVHEGTVIAHANLHDHNSMQQYASQLQDILDRKEEMILSLQELLAVYEEERLKQHQQQQPPADVMQPQE